MTERGFPLCWGTHPTLEVFQGSLIGFLLLRAPTALPDLSPSGPSPYPATTPAINMNPFHLRRPKLRNWSACRIHELRQTCPGLEKGIEIYSFNKQPMRILIYTMHSPLFVERYPKPQAPWSRYLIRYLIFTSKYQAKDAEGEIE